MIGAISQKKLKKFTMKNKEIKLNLGCGNDYKEGYVNIDINKNVRADIYANFIEKIPFKSNSASEIFCKNLFEHIPNPLKFLMEIKRVLKIGGRAVIITSNASYLIYHFPRKKAYHDHYNINHPKEDQHYFMFQKGHLLAFSNMARMKTIKIDYYIANLNRGRDRAFQLLLGALIGKKFGYSDFLWIVEK